MTTATYRNSARLSKNNNGNHADGGAARDANYFKQMIRHLHQQAETTSKKVTKSNSRNHSTMAPTKSDRRRKRSSSSSGEKPSFVVPLILLVGFIVSALIASNEESFTSNNYNDQQQRRNLMNEQSVMDVGVEENVWNRQLRARKIEERFSQVVDRQRNNVGSNRQLAAAVEEDYDIYDVGERPMRRMADLPIRYPDAHHFEECVGTSLTECQVIVDAYVQAHPTMFNNQTTLTFDVRKIRELTDRSYYKVVLRTDMTGQKVYGVFDDGSIYYPWPWRVGGVDTPIGPWDCAENGSPMTPQECCDVIQADVSAKDDYGNHMACFVEEPVGGPNNPERDDRAIVVSNVDGIVVRAPIAH